MILSGIITGVAMFIMVILLMIKIPIKIRLLIYGYALFSDIVFTLLMMGAIPLTGGGVLVGAVLFNIIFSIYLSVMRKTFGYAKIKFQGIKGVKLITYNRGESNE